MDSSADSGIIAAMPPPPGVTPNFENGESNGYQLVIVGVIFPILALCFLLPRLYTAHYILRKWHMDDYLIIVGFLFAVANSIICITQTTMGMGNHIWDIPFTRFQALMKLGMIGGAMTYNLATLFIKLAILSFYLRFSAANPKFRIAVYVVMFFVVGYSIPNAFLFLYICKPMEFYWNWTIPGKCINQNAVFHSANILNMATDYMILLMPIWMLWDLRVGIKRKIGVMGILMAGGFVCGVSTMRMVTALKGANQSDITWHYPTNLIWCLVEMDIGVVCACLPSLRALFKQFFPNLFVFSPAFENRLTATLTFRRGREQRAPQPQALESRSTIPFNQGLVSQDVTEQRGWWRRRDAHPDIEQADHKQGTDVILVQVIGKTSQGSDSGKT